MSKRFPAWVVAPGLILLSVTAILVVGRLEMGGPSPTVTTANASASDSSTPVFPDFSGATVDGGSFHLKDFQGKVVLVNFWATWCGPCQMEIPDLIALQKRYGPRGFVVVGLSEDADPATAEAFAKQAGINYPILKTPDALHQQVQVDGLPTSFLLDRNGRVARAISGIDPSKRPADMWAVEIEKVL